MQIGKISRLSNKQFDKALNFKNNSNINTKSTNSPFLNEFLSLKPQNQMLPQTPSGPQTQFELQNQLQPQIPVNSHSKPKFNFKTLIFDTIIIFTLSTLIANLIKGKSKTAQGVKTFIDKNENKVKNVNLIKGKALLSDGSAFSGTMETTNKQGDKFKFCYEKGILKKSYKNDFLFKTYKTPVLSYLSDNQKLKITKYLQSGEKESVFEITRADGKLKRTEKKGFYALDFDNQGRICAKEVFENDFKKRYSLINYKKSDKSINARDVEKKAQKIKFFDINDNCTKEYLKKDDMILINNNKTKDFITISFSNGENGLKIEKIDFDEAKKKKNTSPRRKIKEEINFAQKNNVFENFKENEFAKAIAKFLNKRDA